MYVLALNLGLLVLAGSLVGAALRAQKVSAPA